MTVFLRCGIVERFDRSDGGLKRPRQFLFRRQPSVRRQLVDGLRQIQIRNFRTHSSPVVSNEQVEKALYTVLADGRALPGFEAYRHVVLRVPGLWWLVPFCYVPVFSRWVGHPIYNWVAANRSRLSEMTALSPRSQ